MNDITIVFSYYCSNDIFRMLTGFYECLHEIVLPEQCPKHYLNTSIEEHSTYIASVLDGFDPVKCRSKYPICPLLNCLTYSNCPEISNILFCTV